MTALMWAQYIAAGLVFLFAVSLAYWAYRVFVDRHPLSDVDNEPWLSWLLLILAVLGIDAPIAATMLVLACSVFVGTLAWQLGVACAVSAFVASMLYLAADARDRRRFDQRRLAAKPKR